MKTFVKMQILGRIGSDPEIRNTTESGHKVANFTIVTQDQYTDKDNNLNEITNWIHVTAWKNLAEIAGKYVKKGRLVWVEGKPNYEEEGKSRNGTRITAEKIMLIDYGPNETESL